MAKKRRIRVVATVDEIPEVVEQLSIAELQALANSAGQTILGTKAELIARLAATRSPINVVVEIPSGRSQTDAEPTKLHR